MKKQLLMGTLAAAVMAGAAVPAFAADGLSASAAVASTYLFRGADLGGAAISGSLGYSMAGAYANVWASSGDTTNGNEYDFTAGYAMTLGGVGIDVGAVSYNYSGTNTANEDTTGQLSEAFLKLSMAGATFSYYDNIAAEEAFDGNTGYEYYSLAYSMDKFTGLVGYSDTETTDGDYTHVDLTYAYNSNLSFTLSKIVDDEPANTVSHDALFVVSYNLPIL